MADIEEKQEMKKMEKMEEKVIKQVTEKINTIVEEGITPENLDALGKLIDIHKDLANEEYWKKKEEVYQMRYNDYDDYGEYGRRGVPGTGRGRYGRRGVPGTGRGRYRGEDVMDEMQEHYGIYSEASEEMNRGNYGAESGMVKSAEGIMKNIYEIIEELCESDSPEVARVIKKYAKKISEM